MNELRWILIGFGIVLLAGIYLWGRRGGAKASETDAGARLRPEPPLHAHAGRDEYGRFDVEHPPAAAEPLDAAADLREPSIADEPTVTPNITAVRPAARVTNTPKQPPAESAAASAQSIDQESWHRRVEPTFSDAAQTEELPVSAEETAPAATAPTLSSSETPPPKRIERRKILSLRLSSTPQRFEGAKLLEALRAESLEHGKYSVFHSLHDDGVSVFSIASLVEPGTFDLDKMPQEQFPGVTLFAQLPGPVPGMHALNELVACARRLQASLGGTLQDDRGVPLTVHRIERLRQEVREFERPAAGGARGSTPHSINP